MNTALTLEKETESLAGLITGADSSTAVPTCPGWSLGDLVAHVGATARWAADVVRKKAPAPAPDPQKRCAAMLADPGTWLRESADLLISAVRETGDEQVWTFLGPRPAAFWIRRACNDLIVHRADAAIALGRPFEIDPEAAGDVIGEGLDLIAMGATAGTTPALIALRGSGRLLLAATDAPARWSILRTPAGVEWTYAHSEADSGDGDAGDADVTVRGPVTALLLMFSRRRSPDDLGDELRIEGDEPLLSHWLDHTAF